jgi:hypothetical protein
VKGFRKLSGEQQRAGAAAAALFLTLFLPWYSHPVASLRGGTAADRVSGFEAFSFVEAAVLIVSAAILYLLWARSQDRGFHLPGGDGWAVTIGGGWVAFLLVWRVFDKPDFTPGPVGIEWGLFVALVVAAVLVAMGQRMRAEHKPEPPNPAADDDWAQPGRRRRRERPDRRPVDSRAVTRTLRDDRPAWEGDPPEAPSRAPRPSVPELPDLPTRRLPSEDAPARGEEGGDRLDTQPLWDDTSPPRRSRSEPRRSGDAGAPDDDERLF